MKRIVFICIIVFHISCSEKQETAAIAHNFDAKLLTEKVDYIAGETIQLNFQTEGKTDFKMLISNAYGASILRPEKNGVELLFSIPKNYSRKSGPCNWSLFASGEVIQEGILKIAPKIHAEPTLETYFGPRSITAGDEDYSMLIAVTTDPFDNVYPEDTEVLFKLQFLSKISDDTIRSKDLISWKNIYATKKAGRILVNTSYKEVTSKELTTIVFPSLAETFLIEAERNHTFADGNQIMKFRSEVIRDKYDNIVSDGTMVNFIIKNSKGAILSTMAPAINGISKATMLHPSEKETWQITAFVTGAAKSNTIDISFETAISDFELNFSDDNRVITVGPIESFMNQLVPDGILIQLDMYNEVGSYVATKKRSSIKGFGTIELPVEYHPKGKYHLVLKAAGIRKEFDVILDEK